MKKRESCARFLFIMLQNLTPISSQLRALILINMRLCTYRELLTWFAAFKYPFNIGKDKVTEGNDIRTITKTEKTKAWNISGIEKATSENLIIVRVNGLRIY